MRFLAEPGICLQKRLFPIGYSVQVVQYRRVIAASRKQGLIPWDVLVKGFLPDGIHAVSQAFLLSTFCVRFLVVFLSNLLLGKFYCFSLTITGKCKAIFFPCKSKLMRKWQVFPKGKWMNHSQTGMS